MREGSLEGGIGIWGGGVKGGRDGGGIVLGQ